MLAVTDDGAWLVQTPYLPEKRNGSGDVTSALFSAHLRATGDAAFALGQTAASVFELVENTHNAGVRELLLIESQEAYVAPRRTFAVAKVR
jgi:pyridoxine kinase